MLGTIVGAALVVLAALPPAFVAFVAARAGQTRRCSDMKRARRVVMRVAGAIDGGDGTNGINAVGRVFTGGVKWRPS